MKYIFIISQKTIRIKARSFLCGSVVLWFIFFGQTVIVQALEIDFTGRISSWTLESRVQEEWRNNSGLRYIPQLTLEQSVSTEAFFDIEASLNGFVSYDSKEAEEDAILELYRLKLRYATAQTETRIGLQKINFGPAQLRRSLMWFDRLDPRDPQKLTDGVYALRFTYNALNNANLWLWGLYGNDDRKGSELRPSVEDTPEFGGRLQYPVFDGELAATVHTRKVDAPDVPLPDSKDFRENRFALDGRWEVTAGLWFEAVMQHQDTDFLPYKWTKLSTLGLDYTFGIGNGVYAVAEHFTRASSDDAFGWDDDAHVSAFSLSYPIGLFDNFQAIGYYSWEQEEYSQYLSWQRAYDNLMINASAFRYPDNGSSELQQSTFGRGYGGQLMLIYYH